MINASNDSAIGLITNAFPGAGQTWAQDPQPTQSSAETCILYAKPSNPFPTGFLVAKGSGEAFNSSSFIKNGLIAACGQT